MAQSEWNHARVYQALVDRGEPSRFAVKEPYVMLYLQEPNCAVLYAPTTQKYRYRPLHLNHDRSSWRADVFERIRPAIDEGIGDSQGFLRYRVLDWDLLATRLGLVGVTSEGGLVRDVTTMFANKDTSPTEKESLGAQATPAVTFARPEKRRILLTPEDEESRHPEGAASYRLHRQLERDTSLAEKAKLKRLAERRRLSCDVCEFDFEQKYGELGAGYIEAHHTVPVSQLTGDTRTQLSDLALVCSNCHRMLHRGPRLLSIDELKALRQQHE